MEPPIETTKDYLKKVLGVFRDPLFLSSICITCFLVGLVSLTLIVNFNLFRYFCTILAACICFLIFGLFTFTQMSFNDGFFMVIGLGYGFVGLTTLLSRAAQNNTLGGSNTGQNVSVQLLLVSRYVEIIAFFVAIAIAKKTFRGWIAPLLTFIGFIIIEFVFVSMVLWWRILPDTIDEEGKGTKFRLIMESVLLCLFFSVIVLIIIRRKCFNVNVFVFLTICAMLRMLTALMNIASSDFREGAPLILANLLRLASFTFIFLSVGLSTWRNPMETLFRNLDMKHMALENEKIIVAWMIEQVPAIAILLNESGAITHMNRYATKTLEYDDSYDWSRTNFFKFFDFEDDEHAYKLFRSLVSGKLPSSLLNLRSTRTVTEDNRIIEWTLKRVKTSTNVSNNPSSNSSRSDLEMSSFHSSQSSSAMDSEEMARVQILCLGQDITDKIERENLLAKARNDAEKLSQMKDSFVANISHELRTPLNCIVGVTDLLQQAPMTESQREMVSMIKIAANSLLSLINDLLDLAKMKQKGEIQLTSSPIDLRSFVETCIMSVAVLSQTGQAEFAYRITKDCPKTITSDEKRLRQVLFNLLSNAIKFTTEGQIILKVSYLSKKESMIGRAIEFKIIDSGIGIKETDLPHLFDRFFQADQGKLKKQGTGIGLTITKQLIELMGGKITATSQVGVGTTMTFVIPLTERDMPEVSRIEEKKDTNVISESDDSTPEGPKRITQDGDTVLTDGPNMPRSPMTHVVLFYLKNQVVSTLLAETISEDYGYDCTSFASPQEVNEHLPVYLKSAPRVLTIVVEVENTKTLDVSGLLNVQKAGAWIQIICVLNMSDYIIPSDNHFPDEFRIDSIRKIIQVSTLVKLLRRARRKKIYASDSKLSIAFKSNSPLVSSSDDQREEKKQEPQAIKELKILIVEDNMTNQKVMKLMLDQIKSVKYDMAENGEVGVKYFLENRYDCIFMDCQMPVMDGIEATQEIRRIEAERPELGRTHITALTANAFADEKEKCFVVGMDDYISKPISLKTFITKLDSLRANK